MLLYIISFLLDAGYYCAFAFPQIMELRLDFLAWIDVDLRDENSHLDYLFSFLHEFPTFVEEI